MVLRYFIPHFWKYYRIIRHRSLTFFTYFCKHMRSSIICMLSGNCVNVACMCLRILKTSQTKFLGNACTHIQNLLEAITRFCFDFYLSSFLLPLPTLPSQNKTTNKKKKSKYHNNNNNLEMNNTRPFTNILLQQLCISLE